MSQGSKLKPILLAIAIVFGFFAQAQTTQAGETSKLVVAGGCFWCVEADFEKIKGVKSVVSGFTGGTVSNPTYKQVVRGGTGHYEAIEITFDPDIVSEATLLRAFFRMVDPTDAGGQFCDRGPAYRTAIFATPGQKPLAETAKAEARSALNAQIVTPILPLSAFYPAEAYHQDYYKQQANHPVALWSYNKSQGL